MESIEHPVFGDVEVDDESEFQWSDVVELGDREIDVELFVEDTSAGVGHFLDLVSPFISRLGDFDTLAREVLRGEHGDEFTGTVHEYQQSLLATSAEDVAGVWGSAERAKELPTFLDAVALRRVSLTPEAEEACASFDYTVEEILAGQRLVVTFDDHRDVSEVSIQS